MMNDLCNQLKKGKVTLAGDDSGSFSTCQCQFLGKTSITEVIYPYGLSASAPVGSNLHIFRVMNDESNLASIASAPFARFKNLKAGEVVIGNFVTGSYVKFSEDGSIEVVSKGDLTATIEGNMTVTAATITLNGDVQVNGTLSSTGIGNFGGPDAKAIARVGDQVQIGLDVGTIITGGTGKSA